MVVSDERMAIMEKENDSISSVRGQAPSPKGIELFVHNIMRIKRLVEGAQKTLDQAQGFEDFVWDVVRAGVVLLHASMEDTLRGFLSFKLSESSEKVLNDIPLVSFSKSGQPMKFFLGELSKHKGKMIDSLIQDSIDDFLNRKSFTSTDDIASMLNKADIDLSKVRGYFPILEEMISRRHQIVHKGDRITESGKSILAPIKAMTLGKWVGTVSVFICELHATIYPEDEKAEDGEYLRQFKKELEEY